MPRGPLGWPSVNLQPLDARQVLTSDESVICMPRGPLGWPSVNLQPIDARQVLTSDESVISVLTNRHVVQYAISVNNVNNATSLISDVIQC